MLHRLREWANPYFHFWYDLAKLNKRSRIYPVDFHGPWTAIVLAQKRYLGVSIMCEIIIQAFYALYPIFLGMAIESLHYSSLVYLMGLWLFINFLEYVSVYHTALLEVQCINSVQNNAFNYFLTIDPIYHTMKSTGKLFAKIERGARAYEDFIDIILWDILPLFVSVLSIIVALSSYDWKLMIVALTMLLLICFMNVALNLMTALAFEQRIINRDDEVKALCVESLTQVQLIRSSFATNEISDAARNRSQNLMYTEGTGWLAFAASTSLSRLVYVASIFILCWMILGLILNGSLTVLAGSTLVLAYVNSTYEVNQIGRRIRKLMKAITQITDLYSFVRSFGKQSFPVLAAQKDVPHAKTKDDFITIEARDIHFDYNPKAKIFDEHTLFLEIDAKQHNKLYGIIGPSGMGKTTLLSLLGGQLKPDRGTIKINGVPLYEVDDAARRSLIAIQGQIASSLSGTVKSNLLLGLPHDQTIYNDDEIISVLKEVGIWPIFEEKEGLATPIGESGLTLSGGQRQRLNFASLYLRAQYYKPAVILIDEPTSSLDEVSERSITTMISHLAQRALTLVIAHRLKTLDDAIGILDFSLLDREKEIVFYNREELAQYSVYYKRLREGDVDLEH